MTALPIAPMPRSWRIQPVDVGPVAVRLAEAATSEPAHRLPDLPQQASGAVSAGPAASPGVSGRRRMAVRSGKSDSAESLDVALIPLATGPQAARPTALKTSRSC